MWLSVEQIIDPKFPLRFVQSSHVKILGALMRALAFDYRNGLITVMWSAEGHSTETATEDAFALEGSWMVMKEGCKMVFLDVHRRRSALCHLKVEGGQKLPESSLRTADVIGKDGQIIRKDDMITVSANDEHFYRNCAHRPLKFVRDESRFELHGSV